MPKSDSRSEAPSWEEPPPDILARIDAREREIELLLDEARQAAVLRMEDARRREAAILAAHREEAEGERNRVSCEIVAEAGRRAEQILAAGVREAAAIRAVPGERVESAAGRLVSLLLPGARHEAECP